ncbi:2OG-Fe(II) oxygenase superfamily protein [Poronia punctata]|nr:2OG-Fe(II) oxygenase superfamily protein [Poronia punctata]
MSTTFQTIPTIDLSLLSSPSSPDPPTLLSLRHALIDVGFLYITNHGIPQSVIDDLVEHVLPSLFAMDEEDKRAVALENSPHFLGYSSFGSENTAGNVDRREQFEFATELTATWVEGMSLCERLRGPNQWPKNNDPRIRQIIQKYITSLTNLGTRFLDLVAQALDLSPGTFQPFLSDQHRLKLVHYPPGGTESTNTNSNNQGVGPHKDSSGWWTFLLQASPPEVRGLQVLNKAGSWIDVPAIPGTFVVNIGQAFEVVTGGLCKATTHRVIISGNRERYSVPFFQGVRRDLTKAEAVDTLKDHFATWRIGVEDGKESESVEGREIDSPFLRGKYDTWGEAQLRTKIRSHRQNGRTFYNDVYEKYINDHVT